MRSSAATRRSRQARCTRSRTATGSSRATATRRSACCAGCRRRRSSSGGAATRPAGGTRRTSTSRRSACRSRRRSRTPRGSPGACGSRDRTAVALTLFGDGATSEGAFHEGANIAAVMKAPLVLLCNNNQWAISTPLSAQTAAARLADKAIGYGMPAIRVDGHDVLAVHEAVRRASSGARAGEGPTFVEAVTYRSAPHATADDPSLYIDPERVAAEQERDCVGDVRGVPRRLGVLDDERGRPPSRRRRSRRCGRGSRRPRTSLAAGLELVFAHAYAEPPAVARPRSRRAPAGARHCERDGRGDPGAAPRRGDQRRAPRRARARRDGDGARRGRRPPGRRLPRDRRASTTGSAPTAASTRRSSEAGILGAAVGLCMAGWRPVVEMQYDAFSYPCLDQLITHVGRYRWRTGGADGLPARRPHAVRRRRSGARAA